MIDSSTFTPNQGTEEKIAYLVEGAMSVLKHPKFFGSVVQFALPGSLLYQGSSRSR